MRMRQSSKMPLGSSSTCGACLEPTPVTITSISGAFGPPEAINGTFEDFLAAFPHMEVKEVEGKQLLRIAEGPPPQPRTLTLTVTSSRQLLDARMVELQGE